MAVYTHATFEQIAEYLAQHYRLGALTHAQGILEGVENSNFLLQTEDENGPQRFILTLFEKRVCAADLPFFIEVMAHIAAHGIACPQPMARHDGTYFADFLGKPAAVFSFLPGTKCRTIDAAHCAEVGALSAKLHRAVTELNATRANTLSLAGWQGLYRTLRGKLDAIAPGLEALVSEELAYLTQHFPQAGTLPGGIIHADLFPDNVFFEGDHVSGVIDFYFACQDAFAYDLAITVNAWCFDSPLREEAIRFNSVKAHALIAGYQTLRPFTAPEVAALPILLRGASLRILLTRANDWLHHDPNAIVRPHDPLEYAAKLRFHQAVKNVETYGLARGGVHA